MTDKTLQQEADELKQALHDLAYTILKTTGIVALTERLGGKPRPWAHQAQIRNRWRKP